MIAFIKVGLLMEVQQFYSFSVLSSVFCCCGESFVVKGDLLVMSSGVMGSACRLQTFNGKPLGQTVGMAFKSVFGA